LAEAAGPLALADPAGALAPVPVLPAAVALGLDVLPLHAAMIAVIDAIDKPMIEPLVMNSRRLRRPAMNVSTTSSWSGVEDRRTLSTSE
jgi:hypothetical protein